LKKEDQIYGHRLAEMVKKHSREAFYTFDDPLEAAVFLGTFADDKGD